MLCCCGWRSWVVAGKILAANRRSPHGGRGPPPRFLAEEAASLDALGGISSTSFVEALAGILVGVLRSPCPKWCCLRWRGERPVVESQVSVTVVEKKDLITFLLYSLGSFVLNFRSVL